MKQRSLTCWEVTKKELETLYPEDFFDNTNIWVKPKEGAEIKYIIELQKGQYKTFSLKTKVRNWDTGSYLDCTPGSRSGMRPYYIDNFIHRTKPLMIN